MNRKDLRDFKRYKFMTKYRITLQNEPLWLLALRILNFRYFKKSYLDFIKTPMMVHFFVSELEKMGYVRQLSRTAIPTKKRRMNKNFITVRDFDLECFFHFWFLEVALIVNEKDSIITRTKRLEYFKKLKGGRIDNLSVKIG